MLVGRSLWTLGRWQAAAVQLHTRASTRRSCCAVQARKRAAPGLPQSTSHHRRLTTDHCCCCCCSRWKYARHDNGAHLKRCHLCQANNVNDFLQCQLSTFSHYLVVRSLYFSHATYIYELPVIQVDFINTPGARGYVSAVFPQK